MLKWLLDLLDFAIVLIVAGTLLFIMFASDGQLLRAFNLLFGV